MRSHKSNAVLHRIDHNEKGILGGSLRKFVLLPDRMVQPQERRVHPDGGGYTSYVSEFQILDVIPLQNHMLYVPQWINLKKITCDEISSMYNVTNIEKHIDAYMKN